MVFSRRFRFYFFIFIYYRHFIGIWFVVGLLRCDTIYCLIVTFYETTIQIGKTDLISRKYQIMVISILQCFKNPTGPTIYRPQNRSDSMQKTIFDRTGDRIGESASSHNFFFKLKRCRFDAFCIETMSFYLELESL